MSVESKYCQAGIVLALLSGCAGKPSPPPPAFVVAGIVHPEAGSGAEPVRYPVEVAARYSTLMSFRIQGKLIDRTVRLGDAVHRGQILARLDPVDADKQAASADAALTAATSRFGYAEAQLARDKAQAAENLIAANQLEQTKDAFAAASAGREQAAAQRTLARNNLAYNTLQAEHDGFITSENADTGQVVSAGQAVYGLAWSGDVDANLDAAASDLSRLVVGQPARVTFTALPGREFQAKVREISPAADPQSRTYRVKLTLTTPGTEVRLGMTGDAVLDAAGAGASAVRAGTTAGGSAASPATVFKVPATAVFHEGNRPAVWLVRAPDSVLELRAVKVSNYGARSATVTEGLHDGDRIVQAGVHTVFAGQKVQPVAPLFADEAPDAAQ